MARLENPIGVFDSGIGGLTVVKALMRQLPQESIVYFGDTARVPYGSKSRATIVRFSLENVEFLLRFGVKCIVIACNTSSSWALPTLRKYFKVPIIGVIRPGARAAVQQTRSRRIGVIGTDATIRSRAYEAEITRLNGRIKVFSASCPLFVPLVESGWLNGPVCASIAKIYLAPMLRQRIDTLILGCTHYPLLNSVLQRVVGSQVQLIDSGVQTATEIKGLLAWSERLSSSKAKPRHRFFVTDESSRFAEVGQRFLEQPIRSVEQVNHR